MNIPIAIISNYYIDSNMINSTDKQDDEEGTGPMINKYCSACDVKKLR